MYAGEVNVSQEQLPAFLKTADRLKVKGLAETPGQIKREGWCESRWANWYYTKTKRKRNLIKTKENIYLKKQNKNKNRKQPTTTEVIIP